jgi:hypothetical protein
MCTLGRGVSMILAPPLPVLHPPVALTRPGGVEGHTALRVAPAFLSFEQSGEQFIIELSASIRQA